MKNKIDYKYMTINVEKFYSADGIIFPYTIESDGKRIISSTEYGHFFNTHKKAIEHANNYIAKNFE